MENSIRGAVISRTVFLIAGPYTLSHLLAVNKAKAVIIAAMYHRREVESRAYCDSRKNVDDVVRYENSTP